MLLIAMLVGCGPSYDAFRQSYAEEVCASLESCVYPGETDPTCVETYMGVLEPEAPDAWTPERAADCLDAVRLYGETCDKADATLRVDLCTGLL